MKLKGTKFRTDKKKYFFTQQVIKMCSLLPVNIMVATGIDSFKKGIGLIHAG